MGAFNHLTNVVEGIESIATPLPKANPANINRDGLQDAHIQAHNLWEKDDFQRFLAIIDPDAVLDPHTPSNGVHAPETKPGGMALGTWVHNGRQLKAYDDLHFVLGDEGDFSDQYLNLLGRNTQLEINDIQNQLDLPENQTPDRQAALNAEIDDTRLEARIKFYYGDSYRISCKPPANTLLSHHGPSCTHRYSRITAPHYPAGEPARDGVFWRG